MRDYETLIIHLRECAKYEGADNTFSEAANAIEELLERDRWISVEERPETGWYLVRCNQWGGDIHRIALWDGREGNWTEWTDMGYDITEFVTHYRPFPEPPKEEA